jgi:hypothetical protein
MPPRALSYRAAPSQWTSELLPKATRCRSCYQPYGSPELLRLLVEVRISLLKVITFVVLLY